VDGQPDLLQVVLALRAGRGFADLLDSRQEQADENGDDRDHHQQLDQREPAREPESSSSQLTSLHDATEYEGVDITIKLSAPTQ